MDAYAAVPPGNPFSASVCLFTGLAAELAGPGTAGMTACQLEELLDERGREIQRQLLQDHLNLRAAREEAEARERSAPVTGPDGTARTRLEAGHGRLLATLFGPVRVTRCAWRSPGAGNFCPADAELSCRPGGTLFPGPAGRARGGTRLVRGRARGGHQEVRAGDRQAAGRAGRGARRRRHSGVLRRQGARAVHVLDAGGAVRRFQGDRDAARGAARGHCQGRRPAGEDADPADGRGKANRKRMATLAAVYDAEPSPRRPHDVIAPPRSRTDPASPAKAPGRGPSGCPDRSATTPPT